MGDYVFQVGTVIKRLSAEGVPSKEQIIYIDETGTEVWTIDLDDKAAWPVFYKAEEITAALKTGRARFLQKYKRYISLLLPGDKYFEKHKEEAEKNYSLIAPLVTDTPRIFNSKERGRLVSELAQRLGVRKAKIWPLMRQFWQGGCTLYAMFPGYYRCGQTSDEVKKKKGKGQGKKRGRKSDKTLRTGVPTGRNVTEEDEKKFEDGIRDFVRSRISKNLPDAWQLTKEKYFNIGFNELRDGTKVPILPPANELPSLWQFQHFHRQHRDRKAEIIGAQGVIAYEQSNRPISHDSAMMAFGPGAVYQIDATVGDIYLVSYLDRNLLIGRPIIYLVIDVFSRMIVGFAVTLEGPSWEGAKLALENAFLDKVEFCKKFGIEITKERWNVEGYCEALLGDNGEIAGYNPNSLVDPLGIRVSNAQVGRPDLKAIVERKFRTINETGIVWVPGAVIQRRHVRGKDYRLEAKLDLNQFRKLMIECILFYNNSHYLKKYRMRKFMIADKVPPVPARLWEYGMKKLTGKLRTKDPEVVRLNLLHRDTASIGDSIYFNGLNFTCDTAIRDQWFLRYKGRKTKYVEIVHGPRVDDVYLRLDRGNAFEKCVLIPADQRFEGCDWYDVKDYFARRDEAADDYQTTYQQAAAEFHAKANRIIAEGTQMTNQAMANDTRSKRARIKTKENRNALKAHERKYGPHALPPATTPNSLAPTVPADVLSKPPASKGYIPPARPFDELRQARERRKQK